MSETVVKQMRTKDSDGDGVSEEVFSECIGGITFERVFVGLKGCTEIDDTVKCAEETEGSVGDIVEIKGEKLEIKSELDEICDDFNSKVN